VPENQLSLIAEAHSSSGHNKRLVILGKLGDDPESLRLRQIAAASQGRIVLGGHVSSPSQFLSVAQNADLYIHGHTVGGINPGLVDAMSVGAHIAAFDSPFNREALGAQGEYWSTGDDLARSMNDLEPDQDLARDARVQARNRAESTFAAEEVADAYERLLLAVTRNPEARSVALTTSWEGRLEHETDDQGGDRHHLSDRSG